MQQWRVLTKERWFAGPFRITRWEFAGRTKRPVASFGFKMTNPDLLFQGKPPQAKQSNEARLDLPITYSHFALPNHQAHVSSQDHSLELGPERSLLSGASSAFSALGRFFQNCVPAEVLQVKSSSKRAH